MLALERAAPQPEKRRPRREVLTTRTPAHENVLRGLPSDLNLTAARMACKTLWSWRNRWDLGRRVATDGAAWLAAGGFGGRWSKNDAERAFSTAFRGDGS